VVVVVLVLLFVGVGVGVGVGVCSDLDQLLAEEEKAKKAQIGIWNPDKKNAVRQIKEKFDLIQFFTNNRNKPLHGQFLIHPTNSFCSPSFFFSLSLSFFYNFLCLMKGKCFLS
jgi:hypothetical protein